LEAPLAANQIENAPAGCRVTTIASVAQIPISHNFNVPLCPSGPSLEWRPCWSASAVRDRPHFGASCATGLWKCAGVVAVLLVYGFGASSGGEHFGRRAELTTQVPRDPAQEAGHLHLGHPEIVGYLLLGPALEKPQHDDALVAW
jgi:hypothetical protein